MTNNIVIYTIVHQPRRLRLPAYPIPHDVSADELEQLIFDDALNKFYFHKVARYCYHPAFDLFTELVEQGMRFSIGLSISFVDQAMRWDTLLMEKLKRLVSHQNVELVCVEPYHSFIFYIDIIKFQDRLDWARRRLEQVFGKRPEVAETTEMFMSREIYHSLARLGYKATLAEGRSQTLDWRSPTYLYRHCDKDLALLFRHKELSDDVGYRFSQQTWPGYPLTAQTYVDWIKGTKGDFVFVGWDFETFGEHHSKDTGIFEFLKWLRGELHWRGVETLTISQAVDKFRGVSFDIDLPVQPTTWAGLNGDPHFFFGNPAQFEIFLLMNHAYNVARLTGDSRLIDISLWLCQSDNLHLLQWLGSNDSSEAEVSSYFTPGYWWNLGASKIPLELQQVYRNFIDVAASRLPERTEPARRAKPSPKREIVVNLQPAKARNPSGSSDQRRKIAPLPLASDGGSLWQGTLNVSPGTYRYKLFVNGDGGCDPNCSGFAPEGCALANCVLTVTVK